MKPSEAAHAVSSALTANGFTPTAAEVEALVTAYLSFLSTMDRLYRATGPEVVPLPTMRAGN